MKPTTKTIIIGIIITILTIFLTLFIFYKIAPKKDSKITVYLFHGNTCPHCIKAINTLTEKKFTNYSDIEIKTLEIWDNKDNSALMKKVAEKLNIEARYVPFFIIGDYNIQSFNEEKLQQEIINAKNNKNYQDIVKKVISENKDLNITIKEIK